MHSIKYIHFIDPILKLKSTLPQGDLFQPYRSNLIYHREVIVHHNPIFPISYENDKTTHNSRNI